MSAREWIIGSLASCDVRIDSPLVSGNHCRLTRRGDAYVLEDLGSTNGTCLDGQRISAPVVVRPGDTITLGASVAFPWSMIRDFVSIGRSLDNDVVIPLDSVSGRHARLERENGLVYLVDLGSTNGTAVNDPLNKIERVPLKPTDAVFFGTHRVATAQLLASLPKDPPRQETLLEAGLQNMRPAPAPAEVAAVQASAWLGGPGSPRAWLLGAALSVACAAVVLGGARIFRDDSEAPSRPNAIAHSPTAHDQTIAAPTSIMSASSGPFNTPNAAAAPKLDEELFRKKQGIVALIGLRLGGELILGANNADGSWRPLGACWALRPDVVVCPDDVLKRLESLRKTGGDSDESLVVCTPSQTLAILDRKGAGRDDAGFALASIEAPLDNSPALDSAATPPCPAPGDRLAILSAWCDNDDPAAIVRRTIIVNVDRVRRDDDNSPLTLHCRGSAPAGIVAGSPAFNSSGELVGCVQVASDGKSEIQVTPLSRLAAILRDQD